MRTFLEVSLFLVNVVIWIGPFLFALARRRASLIHPGGFFALYVIFTEGTSLSEHWFGWSGRGVLPGVRLQARSYQDEFWFYSAPLLILAATGIAFHAGVLVATRRMSPGIDGLFYLERKFTLLGPRRGVLFSVLAVMALPAVYIPFVLLGEGSGRFWTVPLLYASNFIPLLLLLHRRNLGIWVLILGTVLLGVRGSKGDYVYYFLPLILYFQHRVIQLGGERKLRWILLSALAAVVVMIGTARITKARGEWGVGGSPAAVVLSKVVIREYAFETFAILVRSIPTKGNLVEGSWMLREVAELLPSYLVGGEKTRTSQEVARLFMPDDYSVLPTAGFYRYFTFPVYHDFGVLGAILGGAAIGITFGLLYRVALTESWRRGMCWPIILYLPIPTYTQMFVNGAFPYGAIHSLTACAVLATIVVIGRLEPPSSTHGTGP